MHWRWKVVLKKPTPEDIRKLNAEVNQLVNQRHLVTTLAITVFGVISAWMIPRQAPAAGETVGGLVFVGPMLLLVVLFLLFLYSHLLRGMLRVFSTYLEVTGGSNWETDWKNFRQQGPYWGYTKPQTVLFLALGVLSMSWPLAVCLAYSLKLEPLSYFAVTLGMGFAYLISVAGMGFADWGSRENSAQERWERLNAKVENQGIS